MGHIAVLVIFECRRARTLFSTYSLQSIPTPPWSMSVHKPAFYFGKYMSGLCDVARDQSVKKIKRQQFDVLVLVK
jgi:hypothetical protein